MKDTPRTDAFLKQARGIWEGSPVAEQMRSLERDLARLTEENAALRKFIKKQQIFTGNGGWITLSDAAIDAAIKEGS